MTLESPRLIPHARGVLCALAIVSAVTTTVLAQLGAFDPAFDGKLWGVRQQLMLPGDGFPTGVAFSGDMLFVTDYQNRTIVAFDSTGTVVPIANAAWHGTDPASPMFGMVPDQIAAAVVRVDGVDQSALLVTDAVSNRVAVFGVTGEHLFTLRLQRP